MSLFYKRQSRQASSKERSLPALSYHVCSLKVRWTFILLLLLFQNTEPVFLGAENQGDDGEADGHGEDGLAGGKEVLPEHCSVSAQGIGHSIVKTSSRDHGHGGRHQQAGGGRLYNSGCNVGIQAAEYGSDQIREKTAEKEAAEQVQRPGQHAVQCNQQAVIPPAGKDDGKAVADDKG